jgi:uncharacterized protein YlxW (UPF0749 family)
MTRLYLAMGGAGLLAVVLAVLLFGQARAAHAARAEAGRLRADLAVCQDGRARLQAAVEAQNAAVAALRAAGEQRAQAVAGALAAAKGEAKAASARADRIVAVEPKGADVCARLLDVDRKIMRTK